MRNAIDEALSKVNYFLCFSFGKRRARRHLAIDQLFELVSLPEKSRQGSIEAAVLIDQFSE